MKIVITGASKGIGKYLFDTFKNEGYCVIGTYNSTFQEHEEGYYKVNVADENSVDSFVNGVAGNDDKFVLINCAGISYNSFAHKADFNAWKKVIDINLVGTFNVIHRFLPLMRNANYGRIINFSSVVSKYPTPGVSAYAASKAAINGLTKSLSIENASKGITVNSINLGYTNAGMGNNDVPESYRQKITEKIPMNRFCEPIEIYKTIKYIIETEYLNGACIDLNGGLI